MTPTILQQATQLRNTAKHLALWLTPEMSPEGKQLADILHQRAEKLLDDVRKVSPYEEPDRFYTT